MYVVNERITLSLGNGRSVFLAPGPRGLKKILRGPNGPVVGTTDEDANLRSVVPADVLAGLIAEGKISEVEQPNESE